MRLLFTGEPITAAEAPNWGLINEGARRHRRRRALALAERITGNAPLVVWASKRVAYGVDDGVIVGDQAGWSRTTREIGAVLKSEDAKGSAGVRREASPVWKEKAWEKAEHEAHHLRRRARSIP